MSIAPAYGVFAPLRLTGTLAADVAVLQERTGTKVPIFQEATSTRTRSGNVYVMGWGGSQRIIASDTLVAGATEPELRFALARSYGWIVANSGLHLALIQGAFLVIGTALAVFISDRIGFRRDDDPVSRLALLGAIMGAVYLVALPFYNGYSRNVNLAADQAGVALTADPAGAIRLEVRRADQSLLPVCPSRFAYWYLTDHPDTGQRISALQGRCQSLHHAAPVKTLPVTRVPK